MTILEFYILLREIVLRFLIHLKGNLITRKLRPELFVMIINYYHVSDFPRPICTSQLFTDGITNKLVGCFNQNNNVDEDTSTDGATNDVVLVRVYGNKTDLLIDRTKETENIRLLHRYGYAPTLYATFQNGLAYEFVPGVTLTPESCREERVARLVAKRMAQMHKVDDESIGRREPMLAAKIDQFLALIPQTFSDPSKHSR